jgi:hypothetical protein
MYPSLTVFLAYLFSREILLHLKIMKALGFVRSDGLKIGGIKWKKLKLWAGT